MNWLKGLKTGLKIILQFKGAYPTHNGILKSVHKILKFWHFPES